MLVELRGWIKGEGGNISKAPSRALRVSPWPHGEQTPAKKLVFENFSVVVQLQIWAEIT